MSTHRPKLAGATRLGEQLYQSWEKAMGAWWDQVLQSPAFLGTMGENLAARAAARTAYERTMEGAMDRMHLPTRKDIGRVARIATLLEERLLAQEDLLLDMKDQLVEAQRVAVRAQIDAAEARLDLARELVALRGEISSLRAERAPVGEAAPAVEAVRADPADAPPAGPTPRPRGSRRSGK